MQRYLNLNILHGISLPLTMPFNSNVKKRLPSNKCRFETVPAARLA